MQPCLHEWHFRDYNWCKQLLFVWFFCRDFIVFVSIRRWWWWNLHWGIHVSCKKENVTAPDVQQQAAQIDTFTTSGKEYVFSYQKWQDKYDDNFDISWNYIMVPGGNHFLFSGPAKNIEVSFLPDNSTEWIKATKSSSVFGPSPGYFVENGYLYLYKVYRIQDENLSGATASIKVKFLWCWQ